MRKANDVPAPSRSFETRARLEPQSSGKAPVRLVQVDNRAATRHAILVALRRQDIQVHERSDWKAKAPAKAGTPDWHYHSIAIHHAGNSFSCTADGAAQMRVAEAVDLDSFGQVSYHYAVDCTGAVFEALDIRYRGAHVEGGNTGVIGIVFLADFSVRGEAGRYGPGVKNVARKRGVAAGLREWFGVQKDRLATRHDEPTEPQLRAAEVLIETLAEHFRIERLGGHREFATAHGSSRACPGAYGMAIAEQLRGRFGWSKP